MAGQSLIAGVGGVALGVSDLARALEFYTQIWGLEQVAEVGSRVYLRASGPQAWVLAIEPAPQTCILFADLDLRSRQAAELAAARLGARGIVSTWVDCDGEPQGGSAMCFTDPRGRHIRLRLPERQHAPQTKADAPGKITHLVLNSDDAAADVDWYEAVLGITVIDETGIMYFMNSGIADHHTLAFAKSDNLALNHIAFEMPSLDAVMRGAGRMRDAGYPIGWGVGRHGPGANVFAYFVGPCGEVIEYTGEVEQVDASYVVGRPTDWQWPPGRNDRWGVGLGPTDALKQAQRGTRFVAHHPALPA